MAEDKGRPGPALRIRNLVRTFQTPRGLLRALDDVSFEVAPGTITGIIGPDGAGKTTLMRILAGIMDPDSGRLEILGRDPQTERSAILDNLGYMPQKFGLYEDLTVGENMDLHADLHGVPMERRAALYAPLLRMTALAPFIGRLSGKLSGGMKQKLGVACSLVHAPTLLLLDEPTVGVDPVSRRELWEILRTEVSKSSTTLLVSTAYMDEAEKFDRVVILYNGKILGEGPPQDFVKEATGHVFLLSLPDMSPRQLEPEIAFLPGVADCSGSERGVRTVTLTPSPPTLPSTLPARITPTPPVFEDAFMLRLALRASTVGKSSLDSPKKELSWGGGNGTQTGGEPAIEIRELTRTFGSFVAVNRLTFSVGRGEIFGLLGANGAGKTTTFRMLAGLLLPSSGTLRIDSQDVTGGNVAALRGRLGYMSQKFSLYSQLTVLQNLIFFSSAYGMGGKRQRDRVEELLEFFDLIPFKNESSGLLPLGFRQRLALAASIMHEPSILLLDEPTSGVDPVARREFWRVISQISLRGISVLVTTHFMGEATACDRLAIMAQGRLVALGSPREITDSAKTPQNPQPTLEEAFILHLEKSGNLETAGAKG
ncbi:MAG: ATP-binding cassette domain-containing protein [Leptospirillia bacterium]